MLALETKKEGEAKEMNENREILAAMRADAARPLREEVQARIPVLLGIAESADTPEESLEAITAISSTSLPGIFPQASLI